MATINSGTYIRDSFLLSPLVFPALGELLALEGLTSMEKTPPTQPTNKPSNKTRMNKETKQNNPTSWKRKFMEEVEFMALEDARWEQLTETWANMSSYSWQEFWRKKISNSTRQGKLVIWPSLCIKQSLEITFSFIEVQEGTSMTCCKQLLLCCWCLYFSSR